MTKKRAERLTGYEIRELTPVGGKVSFGGLRRDTPGHEGFRGG